MAHPSWPLFDLEVRTPRLTLRYIDDELALRLVDLAGRGIHPRQYMPFSFEWTDIQPPQFQWQAMQFYWRCRAETTQQEWRIPLAVLAGEDVVGASDLQGLKFPVLREVTTGSWLGREFQGQGLGKELRIATLTLAFEGFGALYARTEAFSDNAPSLGVTRALGYEPNGRGRAARRGIAHELLRYEMDREHFDTIRRDDIELAGIGEALHLLGLSEDG